MESRRHKNFMMVPNKLWEALYNKPLPEQERQVWDYIYRQTKGWGCEMKELSTYTIGKDLGIVDSCVRRGIRALKKKRRIVVKGKLKGIQEDINLWTLGQISPTKVLGQISPTTRTNKSVLLGQISPLIKEILKRKKKDRVLSKKEKEEKRKADKKGLGMLKEAIEKGMKEKEKKRK